MFDESILAEIGLAHLADDQKAATLQSLNKNLANRVGAILTGQLSEEDLAEFEKILDEKGDEAAQEWLKGKVPNQQEYIDEAKTEIIAEVKRLSSSDNS